MQNVLEGSGMHRKKVHKTMATMIPSFMSCSISQLLSSLSSVPIYYFAAAFSMLQFECPWFLGYKLGRFVARSLLHFLFYQGVTILHSVIFFFMFYCSEGLLFNSTALTPRMFQGDNLFLIPFPYILILVGRKSPALRLKVYCV